MVKIDLVKVIEHLPAGIVDQLKKSPIGKVIDYKMTDATGIGVIVQLENGQTCWFFKEEIEIKEDNLMLGKNKEINKDKLSYQKAFRNNQDTINTSISISYNNDKNIKRLINPVTFIKWLIYSTKDIV